MGNQWPRNMFEVKYRGKISNLELEQEFPLSYTWNPDKLQVVSYLSGRLIGPSGPRARPLADLRL